MGNGLMEYRIYQPKEPQDLKGAVVVSISISGKIDYLNRENNNSDAPARELAERGFKAVIFSPPHHAGSTVPFSIDKYVEFCNYWNKRLKDERFDTVSGFGSSFGAYIMVLAATQANYAALSLHGMPLSVKDVFQNMEPKAVKAYEFAKGKPLLENIVGGVIITGMNILYSGKLMWPNRFGALKIESTGKLMREMAESPRIDDVFQDVPETTRIMATYMTEDGFIYPTLTPKIRQDLEQRWNQKKPDAKLVFDEGTHVYCTDFKHLFVEPGFYKLMDNTAKFFLQ